MSKYIRRLVFPLLWVAAFLYAGTRIKPADYVYLNCLYYLGIAVYFVSTGSFSIHEWLRSIKKGKKFWIPVFITAVAMLIAVILADWVFRGVDTGIAMLQVRNVPQLIAFCISTILLPPLAEELFFRKAMIVTDRSKVVLCATVIFSMILYAITHTLNIFSILSVLIWSLPFTFAYLKTKDVYVSMTAHFITNIIGNGIDAVMILIYMLSA